MRPSHLTDLADHLEQLAATIRRDPDRIAERLTTWSQIGFPTSASGSSGETSTVTLTDEVDQVKLTSTEKAAINQDQTAAKTRMLTAKLVQTNHTILGLNQDVANVLRTHPTGSIDCHSCSQGKIPTGSLRCTNPKCGTSLHGTCGHESGCDKAVHSKGVCATHYQQNRRATRRKGADSAWFTQDDLALQNNTLTTQAKDAPNANG